MRKDMTNDVSVVAEILDAAEVLFLALPATPENGGAPYTVPVNFARVGDRLALHSSRKGTKAGLLRSGAPCGFSALAEATLRTGPKACKFSYAFRSVAGYGVPYEEEDADRRKALLTAIVDKYGGQGLEIDQAVLDKTAIFVIRMKQATARVHP